jgi:hypothetical protein
MTISIKQSIVILSVTYNTFILSVIMLNVVMLSVMAPNIGR